MKDMEQTKYDVFISYSRSDYMDNQMNEIPGNAISLIKKAFTEANISYWIDEEGIDWGDKFPEVISSSIESSSIVVFVSSKNSIESRWVTKEVALADSLEKHIIPIRIDNAPFSQNAKLAFRVVDLNHIDYYKNPTKALDELINAISSYLEEKREEEELKKLEEEIRRQEEEQKKKEEQRKKEEIERLNREQQQKKIAEIENSCKVLNQKETTIESEREKLLLTVAEEVTDSKEQEKLKTFIISTSPIRKSTHLEFDELNAQIAELKEQNDKLSAANDNLESEVKKKDSKIENLESKLGIKRKKTKSKELNINNPSAKTDGHKNPLKLKWLLYAVLIALGLLAAWQFLLKPHLFNNPAVITSDAISDAKDNVPILDSMNMILDGLSTKSPQLQALIDSCNAGFPSAMHKLGKCFETGDLLDGKKNLQVANYLVHIAANQGYANAQTTLGFYFFMGRGRQADYDSSTYWYSEAIKNGSSEAKYYLALAYADGYYTGNSPSEKKTSEAIKLYEESANEGVAKSKYRLGLYYYNREDYHKSKEWFEKALQSDLPAMEESKAQFHMGQIYELGKVKVVDYKKAFDWYLKAATNGEGYVPAMYYLARCYEYARGTDRNITKAREWYKKAADLGDTKAKEKLKNF